MGTLNISFLAAETSRSIAYAQSLEAEGLRIKHSLLFSSSSYGKLGQPNKSLHGRKKYYKNILLPQFDEKLEDILCRISDSVEILKVSDVNASLVFNSVKELKTELIVYSGYGKQIVGEKFIELEKPILHMHAGTLPRFRGSTTIYYEMLLTGKCGVTGIFLDKGIDTGKIVFHQFYPKPSSDINIDHIYDPAIRADALVKFLQTQNQSEAQIKIQRDGNLNHYYVIHPILKHLAVLGSKGFISSGE